MRFDDSVILGHQRPPFGFPGGGLTYLLRDEFTTDAAAPLTSPRTCEPGPGTLTITDTGNKLTIASGILTAGATTGSLDPFVRNTTGFSRVAGRVMHARYTQSTNGNDGGNSGVLMWTSNLASPDSSGYGFLIDTSTGKIWIGAGILALGGTYTAGTYYLVDIVLLSTGFLLFIDQKLRWVDLLNGNQATLYQALVPRNGASNRYGNLDNLRIRDLPASFLTSMVTLDVASPSGSYTATADQILHLTVTAPGVITQECGIKYRVTDANNYWRAYFDVLGAFRVDSVSGGTPTNRINVAGVISAGQTRTIVIECEGSLHDAFTYASTTPTKRGSQVNVSHQNTSTAVEIDAGDWTVSNLRSYPVSSGVYTSGLDPT